MHIISSLRLPFHCDRKRESVQYLRQQHNTNKIQVKKNKKPNMYLFTTICITWINKMLGKVYCIHISTDNAYSTGKNVWMCINNTEAFHHSEFWLLCRIDVIASNHIIANVLFFWLNECMLKTHSWNEFSRECDTLIIKSFNYTVSASWKTNDIIFITL